ncbi:2Fe-2S iron-sulfur cluster-binding protein [Alkalihalobacillus oceani]|uniref:2Fe-2S iron-sulfur cluster-binding protein n=1 Tax=Halalkalibacter oceani TaxID=1653776 RepID=UPI00203DEC15|nr:2Fe-2S iron-sulfur cluster-binding protein [Halalkalibacter oceani]MCM3760060.1 2Fe-2S iron-sulfur cluster-binding protein [Halalkalibacter oceani]
MAEITLHITRGSEQEGKHEETYQVPFVEGMSLLDAIFWIREHKDPTLAVRYSCRSANACKECMAVVDGKAGYLCSIRAEENSEQKIEPLAARPWVKDLTTAIE